MFRFFGKKKTNGKEDRIFSLGPADCLWKEPFQNSEALISAFDRGFPVLCRAVSSPEAMEPSRYTFKGRIFLAAEDAVMEKEILPAAQGRLEGEITWYRMPMHIFLEDLIAGKAGDLVLAGGEGRYAMLTAADARKIEKELEIFQIMYAAVRGRRMTDEEAYERLKDHEFVFIGTLPAKENGVIRAGSTMSLGELTREEGGTSRRSLIAFVNEESACRFGGKGRDLVRWPLSRIRVFYGGKVIIEPYRNWWMEF